MGTDGAWRWRKGVEDKYHYRFWGQVVRWMAYQRNMAKGETMRLYYSPDQPSMRPDLTLHANVMNAAGEPVQDGDVTARITAPSGPAETVRFTSAGDEWGLFSSQFTPAEPGQYKAAVRGRKSQASLDTSFAVQGGAIERIGRPARPEVLEEIAPRHARPAGAARRTRCRAAIGGGLARAAAGRASRAVVEQSRDRPGPGRADGRVLGRPQAGRPGVSEAGQERRRFCYVWKVGLAISNSEGGWWQSEAMPQ